MALELKRRLFTVEEYYRMAAAGILAEDDRVELIEGEIVEMTPIGRRHAACVDRLNYLFSQALRDKAVVRVQGPIRLGKRSEPQPDLVLLRWRPDFYASVDPTPADVLLLVEVADTTAGTNRQVKIPLYARNGIPEVWLIDLQQQTITTYLDPSTSGYRTARVVQGNEKLAPTAFPDHLLAASDILPD